MRTRAEDIAPGDWTHRLGGDVNSSDSYVVGGEGGRVLMATTWPNAGTHIASWHPVVALAVADWLEKTADHMDPELALDGGCPDCEQDGALAVADAYLGSEQ